MIKKELLGLWKLAKASNYFEFNEKTATFVKFVENGFSKRFSKSVCMSLKGDVSCLMRHATDKTFLELMITKCNRYINK